MTEAPHLPHPNGSVDIRPTLLRAMIDLYVQKQTHTEQEEQHFTKLLMGEDPFNVERIWDILWRSSMSYGRAGVVINAISGVDLAMWDLVGNALGMPVYKLLGGETKARIPAYCTGNDIQQHIEFGYKRLKLAIPHGPADGREGMKKNVALVESTRS